ncbi:MAG: MHYT domain-containing protein [Xanthobacteraceae bacterium]
MAGTLFGFAIATGRRMRLTPAIGGAVVGLVIAAMHYTGMMAYRVQGVVSWDTSYLVASIVLSVTLSALALRFASRRNEPAGSYRHWNSGAGHC